MEEGHDIMDESSKEVTIETESPQNSYAYVQVSKKQKPCKKESDVWDHYDQYETGDPRAPIRVKCKYCKKDCAFDKARIETITCRKHLGKCKLYPYRLPECNQTLLSFDSSTSSLSAVSFSNEACRKACVKMVILDELPFSYVVGEGFHFFCSVACPKFIPPSRRTLARDVLALYIDEKKKLKQELSGKRVRLTTDTWTSLQQVNYMVLTAHFIDDDWVLHKKILNFCVITSHEDDSIGRTIEQCLIEWGIEKVLTITVDNAISNDVTLNYLTEKLKEWGESVENGKYMHLKCGAHILNLMVSDGLGDVHESVQSIRNAVRYVRSSPTRLQMFRDCVKKEKLSSKGLVVMDVPTRWNSTYMMLEAALRFKKAFDRMEDEDGHYLPWFCDREGPLLDVDWDIACVFVKFLKTFYDVTLRFSSSLAPIAHMAFANLFSIHCLLSDTSKDSHSILSEISRCMQLKYDKYWGPLQEINPFLFIAHVLDPRFKLEKLKLLFRSLYCFDLEMVEWKTREVKALFSHLYDFYEATFFTPNVYACSSDSSQVASERDESIDFMSDSQRKIELEWTKYLEEKQSGLITNEVDKYLSEALEANCANFDILNWWKVNGSTKFRVLGAIAKDVLSIPVSTVASESAFNTGGRVIDPFRCSLSPKMVEALICTQNWLRSTFISLDDLPTIEEMEFYEEIESEMFSENIRMLPPKLNIID